jgi:prepilin-type N-terminal cleavage/methylation domain-containing protein
MTRTRTRRGARRGMTIVEVLVALTVLGVVMIGMGRYTADFARTVSQAGVRSSASDLVVDRIETIKASGRYDILETTYSGIESGIPGYTGFTRRTQIVHRGGTAADSVDYKIVTVSVTGPRLTTPVKKTTVISSF